VIKLSQNRDFQFKLLTMLKPYWSKVVAFDIESHVINKQFLNDERVLSISLAFRESGKLLDKDGISIKTLTLREDNEESENKLLGELDNELAKIRPLGGIGFCSKTYDLPLLFLKNERRKLKLWKLFDFVAGDVIQVDLYQFFKFSTTRKLKEVLLAKEFSSLPFKNRKYLVENGNLDKGEIIYQLWKEEPEKLREYIEADVYDTLILAEKLLSDYLQKH